MRNQIHVTLIVLCLLGGAFSASGCATMRDVAKATAIEVYQAARPELERAGAAALEAAKEKASEVIATAKDEARRAVGSAIVAARRVVEERIDSVGTSVKEKVAEALEARQATLQAKVQEGEATPWDRVLLGLLTCFGGAGVGSHVLAERRKAQRDQQIREERLRNGGGG